MSRRHKVPQKPAYRVTQFMESVAARPVRILSEYLDPLTRMRRQHIGDTIVIFGSARILPRARALARIERLKSTPTKKRTPRQRDALRQARANLEMSRYYEEARELSRRLTLWSMALGD